MNQQALRWAYTAATVSLLMGLTLASVAWPQWWSFLLLPILLVSLRWGWPRAVLAGLLVVTLDIFFPESAPWFTAGTTLLVIATGAFLRIEHLRVVNQAEYLARDLNLLETALEELSALSDRDSVLRALPALLGRHQPGRISVWIQQGKLTLFAAHGFASGEVPAVHPSGVVGRAWRFNQALYDDRDLHALGEQDGSQSSALALPLIEGTRVVGVLQLERNRPYSLAERQFLIRFARMVGESLSTLAERYDALFMMHLTDRLQDIGDREALQEEIVELMSGLRGCSHALLMGYRAGRFVCLESSPHFRMPDIQHLDDLIWNVYRSNRPLFIRDYGVHPLAHPVLKDRQARSVAFQPVVGFERARMVLVLLSPQAGAWSDDQRWLLSAVGHTVGLYLERMDGIDRRMMLWEFAQELPSLAPQDGYQALLEQTIRMVPGSEGGALLLPRKEHWIYTALVGHRWAEVEDVFWTEEQLMSWYGESEQAWLLSEPRVHTLRHYEGIPMPTRDRKANLMLPLHYAGKLIAVIVLESFNDPYAFAQDSLQMARLLGVHMIPLLVELRYRSGGGLQFSDR